jgi:hypothetical protein
LSADAVGPSLALAVEERSPARRACVVRMGGRSFAVDVVDAREVVVLDAITPVPGAPEPLVGVMNLRGTALPVIEARPLLGLPVRGALRALVVADGDRRAAVLIEAVVGLAGFDDVAPLAGTEGAARARPRPRHDRAARPSPCSTRRPCWPPPARLNRGDIRAGHRGA